MNIRIPGEDNKDDYSYSVAGNVIVGPDLILPLDCVSGVFPAPDGTRVIMLTGGQAVGVPMLHPVISLLREELPKFHKLDDDGDDVED